MSKEFIDAKSMQKFAVSLVIITKNEERNIERCIKSAPFVDEIIVLDSQSTDKTVELAKSLKAKTFVEPFRGFRAQKERATELAKNDWIISLDADEELSDDLQKELMVWFSQTQTQTQAQTYDGLESPRLSYHLGKWIRHGGWYPDYQLRVYNRKYAKWQGGHVHERVKAERVQRTHGAIKHYVFKDLSHQVDTNNLYSTYGAQELFDKGKKFCLHKLLFKPISKFVECYFIKLGFLDGMAGFVIAVGASYSVFLKFSKLYYLEKNQIKN